MKLNAKITEKSQITIPVSIREKFKLKTGSRLEFADKGDFIIMIPINKSVRDLKGLLSK
jgi:AbrB family looped-hinge helix DNA binding protein